MARRPTPAPTGSRGVAPVDALLRALPKAELHVHLDGSLRPATLLELARERSVRLPAGEVDALARHMLVSDAHSLEEYLERFTTTLSVMQDADALRRIARECVLDHAEEGVRYVEIRFCPLLNTERGLAPDEVVDAALDGLRLAEREALAPIRAGLILCGLRSHEARHTREVAELAVAYRTRGVCGFDLAGAEAGHPVADHRAAFDRAAGEGLPITVHAGEGYGPESIRQALELGHARRIGHGTRLHEDPELLAEVARRGILLEVCLTSNVQTGAVPSIAEHPAGDYVRAGIPCVLGTDNRLMSGVTLVDEYRNARNALDLDTATLVRMARAGFEHAFVSEEERAELLASFDEDATNLL